MMAVPQSLRRAEEEQEARKLQKFAELEQAGVDLTQIPQDELALGDGEVLKCQVSTLRLQIFLISADPFHARTKTMWLFQLHWIRTLKRYRESGHPSRAEKLEELLVLIHGWRAKKGQRGVEYDSDLIDALGFRKILPNICPHLEFP